MIFPLKPLGQCCSDFMRSLLGQETERAKMGMVHWSKWLPCPYMVKTLKSSSPEPNKPCALIFAQIMGDRRSTKIAEMTVLCWHLTFLPPRSNLLPHAFVWAIYIYIESIEVTYRSTVVKIVLIGSLRWPSSCLYLLYFPATVLFTCIKPWFFRNHLANFPQICIDPTVVMIELEKCCITSAYLQWLCHLGEQAVAHGPLVNLQVTPMLPTKYRVNWSKGVGGVRF